MVKKVTINCDSSAGKVPVDVYVGSPQPGTHPINFQSRWLGDKKGVSVPSDLMNSLAKLEKTAEENKIPFEDLIEYVFKEISLGQNLVNDANQATALSKASEDKDDKKS